jgi:hypothetical protein
MVIYPPTLRKKPRFLGLLFDIVVTFSIIETTAFKRINPGGDVSTGVESWDGPSL